MKQRPRFGYRRIGALLRREGEPLNMKRMYRLWRAAGLKVPRKRRKKRALGDATRGCAAEPAMFINDVWTWDFLESRTIHGNKLRWLNVVDEYTRRCLAIKVSGSIKKRRCD